MGHSPAAGVYPFCSCVPGWEIMFLPSCDSCSKSGMGLAPQPSPKKHSEHMFTEHLLGANSSLDTRENWCPCHSSQEACILMTKQQAITKRSTINNKQVNKIVNKNDKCYEGNKMR